MKIQKRLGAVLLTAALLGSQLGTAAYPVYALESEPESMASAENLPSETELPMEQEPISSEETLPQEELSSETAEFNEPPSETLPEEQTSVKVENSWRFQNGEPIPAVSDGVNRNSTSTNRWPEASRATAKGVDVSRWHGEIDWEKVYRDSEVEFAVLRCGSGYTYENNTGDERWRDNADACTELGIPFGAYFYSYAMNVEEARKEADIVLELLQGYKLDLPVYYDLEDEKYTGTLSNQEIADIAQAFCERIEAAGYTAGIYANKTWFTTKLTDTRFDQWERWVAQWNDECTYEGDYSMWQWCSDGVIPGIDGEVDLNYWFGKELPNNKPVQADQLKASLNAKQTEITVELSNVTDSDAIQDILFPIWSDKNGQDDLQWYTAKKSGKDSWRLTVPISNHRNDLGIYHIHAYKRLKSSKVQIISATTVNVEGTTLGSADIATTDAKTGQFTVTLTGVHSPAGVQQVQVPVWSDKGGQDDIVWYNAVQDAKDKERWTLTVDPKNHRYDSGMYHVHVYAVDNRGIRTGLKAMTTNVKALSPTLTVKPDSTHSNIVITLSNPTSQQWAEVLFPVWSELNGQDDLVWYGAKKNSSGVWTLTVPISKHRNNTGVYNVHAYKKLSSGKVELVSGTTVTIEPPKMESMEISPLDEQTETFTVSLRGVTSPAKIKQVLVPVWSAKDGQDDLIWYGAVQDTKNPDNWSVTIDPGKHGFDTGLYHVHVYAVDNRGIRQALAANSTTINLPQAQPELTAVPDESQSQIDVTLTHVRADRDLLGVLFPVWSDKGGQDDLVWYSAEQASSSTWTLSVPISQHNKDTGLYHIHAYKKYKSGKVERVDTATANIDGLDMSAASISAEIIDSEKGIFRVQVSGVSSPAGIKEISLPVWSDKNGQDDLRWWYQATKTTTEAGDVWTAEISAANHLYDSGLYHIHVYATDNRGIQRGVGSTTLTLNPVTNSEIDTRVAMVETARSQLGQEGGKPYWTWYGYSYRIEWCACFVSWCADQNGLLNNTIPRSISCGASINWFKQHNAYTSNKNYVPQIGDIIFYDWGPDGEQDHVGIVESINGDHFTVIEGNQDDKVGRRYVEVGDKEIFGFGLPKYK